MKKKLTALVLCALMLLCLAPSGIAETADNGTRYLEINAANFPDAYVRQWIIDHLDTSGTAQSGYYMTEAQVQGATVISMSGYDGEDDYMRQISLAGLELLTNIQELYLEAFTLKPHPFSGMKNLKKVCFEEVTLLEVNFSGCTALESVEWDKGKDGSDDVGNLDFTGCTNLKRVVVSAFNADVKNCAKLETLILMDNLGSGRPRGKALHLDTCPALKILCCTADSTFDVSKNTKLQGLFIGGDFSEYGWRHADVSSLDFSRNTDLRRLGIGAYVWDDTGKYENVDDLGISADTHNGLIGPASLDLSANTKLEQLCVVCYSMKTIDLTQNAALKDLWIEETPLTALDVTHCPKLEQLACVRGELKSLNVSSNPELRTLDVTGNHLKQLNISSNPKLTSVYGEKQTLYCEQGMQQQDGRYTFDLKAFTGANPAVLFNVREEYKYDGDKWMQTRTNAVPYDKQTGVVTSSDRLLNVCYKRGPLDIAVWFPYDGEIGINWNPYVYGNENIYHDYVRENGETPYMEYQGKRAHAPRYDVFGMDHNGDKTVWLSPVCYTGVFSDNKTPGTATLKVTTKNTGRTCSNWFKIYLPATEATDVANTQDGVRISWDAVKDAKGYVIYRRAWSSTTDGWTAFQRWNNTTATTWTDTKVYAGTRYQYGVKAYYSDPMDNYNLGMVGPLKTTVRITTQTLKSVTAGSKQLTAKWSGSKTVTGYQIKYATNAAFTQNVGSVKVAKPDVYQTAVKNLQSGKTYYVTVRAYQVFGGMTYFGEWSNVLSCKVK